MADVGTMKMRMPNGKQSAITVSRAHDGSVEIHFSRTSEGEALMRLPVHFARELGDLLIKAAIKDINAQAMAMLPLR